MALLLLVGTTLLAHALWQMAEMEVQLTRMEVHRAEASRRARARAVEVAARQALGEPLDSTLAHPLSATLSRIRVPESDALSSLGAGAGRPVPAWSTILLSPDPASLLEELGAGAVTGRPLDSGTAGRIVWTTEPGCAGLPPLPIHRSWWDPPGLAPTLAGLTLPAVIEQLPELSGSELQVQNDSTGPVIVGARQGSVALTGVGTVLIAADRITVRSGARIGGLLIARDEVRVESGAILAGAVVAGERLLVSVNGRVEVAPCRAAEALASSPLTVPRIVGPPAWPNRIP